MRRGHLREYLFGEGGLRGSGEERSREAEAGATAPANAGGEIRPRVSEGRDSFECEWRG